MDLAGLEEFVVRAKTRTWVGAAESRGSSRPGSTDLTFADAEYGYLDSYVGGTDFIGQELVTYDGVPVWAMNYYGYLLRPDLIDGAGLSAVVREALTAMYAQGRFLGGWRHVASAGVYEDESTGDVTRFFGRERVLVGGDVAYELSYHGGLARP